MNKIVQKLFCFYNSRILLLIIITLGIVLRLALYSSNYSLWLDESMLTLNIVDRTFWELFQPLDYIQGAPIGFLIIEKIIVKTLGNNEYALRLFPLLSGIISIILFYLLSKKCLISKAVPIALLLFAILPSLVNYSSEVKQYSSDVAIALLLFLLTINIKQKKLTTFHIALLGIVGAISIWFSHPAIFILCGAGVTLIIFSVSKKDWPRLGRLAIIYSIWIVSFSICYFVNLDQLSNNKGLLNYWAEGFMPFLPKNLYEAQWLVNSLLNYFGDQQGLSLLPGAALLIFIIGCISMFYRRKKNFILLIMPILFVIAASAFHKYPFKGQLLLFIVPIVLLFIVEGIEAIRIKSSDRFYIIKITLIGILLFPPLLSAGRHFSKPFIIEEIKPVLSYLNKHWQKRDQLYLYYHSWFPFKCYYKNYAFDKREYIKGLPPWGNYLSKHREDLSRLRGRPRVWVLLSHIVPVGWKGTKVNDEKFYLSYLNSIGAQLDSFKANGVSLYLYDLNKAANNTEK